MAVICQVTIHASRGRGQDDEVARAMAVLAGCLGGMRARQRESGRGVVVESAGGPVEGSGVAVAASAVLRKQVRVFRVGWILRDVVVVILVAVPAGRACQAVVVVDVA